MVVALLITAIVFILATAMLADAFHNVVGSAQGRARLTAVNAAESGIAWYSNTLESANLAKLRSVPWTKVSTNTYAVLSAPLKASSGTASYDVSATYSCEVPACPDPLSFNFTTLADANAPSELKVTLLATGHAGSTARTLRAEFVITPSRAALSGAYGGMFLCALGNRFTITGTGADIYLQGGAGGCVEDAFVVTSGQFTTSGSVYVQQGGACLTSTTKIDGNLWANKEIVLGGSNAKPGCSTGEASILKSVPCGSSSAQVLICGDVTSRQSISVRKGAGVVGQQTVCPSCPVPTYTFPSVSSSAWVDVFDDAPWTTTSGLPTAGDLSASGAPSGKKAYNATGACAAPLLMPGKNTLYLKNDMAIIADCGFEFANRVEFRRAPGASGIPTLYLLTGDAGGCPGGVTDKHNTSFQQNFSATDIHIYVYSPCRLNLTNQTNLTGQVLARQLYAQGRTTINAVNVLGLTGKPDGAIVAFRARVISVREV